MAFVLRTATTLRNHWKKSLFGFMVALYGAKYFKNRSEENQLLREYCEEAKKYGEQPIRPGEKPKRLTVFLNPASQRGKGRKLFERYAEPILNLAGFEVNIVTTEFEGHVKQFLTVLEAKDTDILVVAGGGGTLLEAVTGVMRKEDNSFRRKVPLGVLPLGAKNYFAKLIYGPDLDQSRLLAKAAISVVRGFSRTFDVMKIEGEQGKTTFALCGLETGVYRDASDRMANYWYLGPLKSRWTYLRTALSEWPPVVYAEVSYVEATEERLQLQKPPPPTPSQPQRRSWLSFLYKSLPAPEEETDQIFVDSFDEEMTRSVVTTELTLASTNFTHPQSLKAMELSIGPSHPSRTSLIREGWRRHAEKRLEFGSDTNEKLLAKKIRLVPKTEKGKDLWFNIDGEAFEAMPVEVSILKDRLRFICARDVVTAQG